MAHLIIHDKKLNRTAIKACIRALIFIAVFHLTLPVTAQVSQPKRYEQEQKSSDDPFNVISLKASGIALFRELDRYKQGSKKWQLIILDTALNEKANIELDIMQKFKMLGFEVSNDRLYFLFRGGETPKSDMLLIELTFNGEEKARYTIKTDLDFRLTHFVKAGANFAFGGYVGNEPAIIVYDITASGIKVVPGFFQKDTELVDLRANENQTFNTVLVDRSLKGERKLVFRTYDETGKLLLEDTIVLDDDLSLQTGITSALQREDLMIMGTWGLRNSKQSNGFYTISVNPFADQKIKYINFGQLDHFVDYLSPKRAERIKESTKEDAAAGKTPNFSSYVMPFRISESKEGFYLLAEVYNPSSSTSPYYANPYYYNPYYSPYGYSPYWTPGGYYYPGMSRMYRPYMYGPNVRSAEDIKSLSSVLLAIDSTGKVRWDHSFKLDDLKLPGVEQVTDFHVRGNRTFLVYRKESELKVKIISGASKDIVEENVKIKTLEPNDEIRSNRDGEGGVRYWYGDSFYVWGYQTIRNNTKKDKVRNAFYVNRIDVK